MDEQQRIVESIDANGAPVNATISRLEREIDLLREYRTRLVADVVTGKLDVREAAARLPDETEQSERLEEVGLLAGCDNDAVESDLDVVAEKFKE
jgi:type I restriction enzyme S subunit